MSHSPQLLVPLRATIGRYVLALFLLVPYAAVSLAHRSLSLASLAPLLRTWSGQILLALPHHHVFHVPSTLFGRHSSRLGCKLQSVRVEHSARPRMSSTCPVQSITMLLPCSADVLRQCTRLEMSPHARGGNRCRADVVIALDFIRHHFLHRLSTNHANHSFSLG